MDDLVEMSVGLAILVVVLFVGILFLCVGAAIALTAFIWMSLAAGFMAFACVIAFFVLRATLWSKPSVLAALEEGRERGRTKTLLAQDVTEATDLFGLQIALYLIAVFFTIAVFVIPDFDPSMGGLVTWVFRVFALILFFKLPSIFLPRFKSILRSMALRHLHKVE